MPDHARRARGGGRGLQALAAVCLFSALGALAVSAAELGLRGAQGTGRAVVADGAAPRPTPLTGTTAQAVRAPREPGAPRRLRIPSLGVDAPVLPVAAPGRTLVPPADPRKLGWWADGARPGAAEGSALVAGHTVHTGGGALDRLETLDRGARVVVRTDRGRVDYVVRRVAVYDKGRIAADAERLFDQDAPGRLVLLTCEDWDGARYLSNVVVVATPA